MKRILPLLPLLLLVACNDGDKDDTGPVHTGEPPETGDDTGSPDTAPDDTSDDTGPDDTGPTDADGDGWIARKDCDDHDASVHPGATEECDGEDDDCDGLVDEDFPDTDGDGEPDCGYECPLYVDDDAAAGGDGTEEAPFDTITAAIESRDPRCEEIVVLPGLYAENVDFGAGDLWIWSVAGAAETVIEPPAGGSAVTIAQAQTPAATLQGFTLRGGTGTPGNDTELEAAFEHGGGLYVMRADPTILDCVLEANTVTGRGAGALLYRWGGLFQGNEVTGNRSTADEDWNGAGIYLYRATGRVIGNVVVDNVAEGASSDGGGVMIARGSPEVAWNEIRDNAATATGGGIRSAWAEPSIHDNLIVDNAPDGVALSYDDAGSLVNNTIAGSSENGIRLFTTDEYTGTDGPVTAIVNNVVSGSGRYGVYVWGLASPSAFAANDVFGSGTANYHGLANPTGTDGNLSVNPQYVGGGDYRLSSASPCVDAGEDASGWGSTEDLDGVARPVGGGWDIGAYESW